LMDFPARLPGNPKSPQIPFRKPLWQSKLRGRFFEHPRVRNSPHPNPFPWRERFNTTAKEHECC
jgi:hypothetical protein